MGRMITFNGKLIRINEKDTNKLESSTNNGRNWSHHCGVGNNFNFEDLVENGSEILATTSKGLYVSKNGGKNWSKRN